MKLIAAAGLVLAAPAAAEVKQATPAGFEIESTVTVAVPVEQAWEVLRSPQRWWNPEHTYSGDAAKLYLDAQATGCFCERTPDKGSIEHAHIVYVQPPRMIRMVGALGPLQAEAVTGTMTWKVDPGEGGGATTITMSYLVGGYMRQGGETFAPLVDRVLTEQLTRLKAAIDAAPAAAEEAK
ncbi:SRPBCC family protein [Sphingomonas gilva]|uniref:SRPBCC family protein n=1 Tax=Sphingomonas gilva TaxID=2305907 RepID=A0A396RS45_9SPHN|nr:SRPBCC family protein [Sphingomonas gilva]RHW19219.1 SRPBCC family protein [Sphingomonas gilva]